ncbi:MAG: tetratricopeptide repeat protein, partial [Planctomycetes bacterium]|nr:tetratricopeptide repeat protein [Planctomycetota bacterium]
LYAALHNQTYEVLREALGLYRSDKALASRLGDALGFYEASLLAFDASQTQDPANLEETKERAFNTLLASLTPNLDRDIYLVRIGHPCFESLRNDPRWVDVVSRVKELTSVKADYSAEGLQRGRSKLYAAYGEAALDKSEFDEAKRLTKMALDLDPSNQVALMGLSRIRLLEGDHAGALEAVQLAIESNPRDFGPHNFHASLLMGQQRYKDAAEVYRQILEGVPTDNDAIINYIHCLSILKDDKAAMEALDNYKRLVGEDLYFWYARGVFYDRIGKPELSRQAYEKAVSFEARSENERIWRGESHQALWTMARNRGDSEAAEFHLTSALEYSPNLYDILLHSAWSRTIDGDLEGGRNDFDTVIKALEEIESRSEDQTSLLVRTLANSTINHSRMGNLELALRDAQRALELDPKSDSAYSSLAEAYLNAKRYEDSDAATAKALELNPKNALALNLRGISHYQRKKYAEALELFERYLSALPPRNRSDIAIAHGNRGNALVFLDRREEAVEAYKTSIATAPKAAAVMQYRLYLSNILLAMGSHDDALKAIDELLEITPNNAYAWYKRALVQIGKGDPEGALQDFQAAISEPRKFSAQHEASAIQDIQRTWPILNDVIQNKDMLQIAPLTGDDFAVRALVRLYYASPEEISAATEKSIKDLQQADALLNGESSDEGTPFRIYYACDVIIKYFGDEGGFDTALVVKRLAMRYAPGIQAYHQLTFQGIGLALAACLEATTETEKKPYFDQCFEFLNLALESGFTNWQGMAEAPAYQPLHSDPRWAEFLEKIK